MNEDRNNIVFDHDAGTINEAIGLVDWNKQKDELRLFSEADSDDTLLDLSKETKILLLSRSVSRFNDSSSVIMSVGKSSDESWNMLDEKFSVVIEWIYKNISDDFLFYLLDRAFILVLGEED